ncbi:MAG: GNAT family N-acetyltransferase [Hyphomonadaceae bacterium]|nr:GNAT family N-acetyltransferase [Hyphomonadaceae bacterium]
MKREIQTETRDGASILLRPLCRADRPRLARTIEDFSDRSRYMRFFTCAKRLPDHVIDKLVDVDNSHHIAWGALDEVDGEVRTLGGCHAMRRDEGAEAELAFGVLDAFHGQGVARMLIAAVVHDCARMGITTLHADTLSENRNAANLLRRIGGFCVEAADGVYTFRVDVREAERRLRQMTSLRALDQVFQALDTEDVLRAA